jgi:hypothetical protein
MSVCYCDYDAPAFYVQETRKARKQHRCYECNGPIFVGEQYSHIVAKWDSVETVKTCPPCFNVYQWTKNNVPCICPMHGDLMDSCQEAIGEAIYRAPEETRGIYFGFLRRRYERDRLIKERKAKASGASS